MAERVIRRGRVESDLWLFVSADGIGADLPAGPIVVPLAAWKERRAELLARREPVGVWLEPGDEPAEIAPDLASLALVAVHFPKFADGRGYSTAVLLRTRFGYRGELRAFGDVGHDHLFQLARCGFDAFRLAPHRDPEAALSALEGSRVRYQGAVDDQRPLFRRRQEAP